MELSFSRNAALAAGLNVVRRWYHPGHEREVISVPFTDESWLNSTNYGVSPDPDLDPQAKQRDHLIRVRMDAHDPFFPTLTHWLNSQRIDYLLH